MPETETTQRKPYTGLIRRTQKNGWIHVYKITSVYDPKYKNRKIIASELVGKLEPGVTDLSKMLPTDKRYSRKKAQVTDIAPQIKDLEDPRATEKVIYPLDLVVLVVILATTCGYKSCYAIAEYWKNNREIFAKWFADFPNRDISHDTIRRLLTFLGRDNAQDLLQRLTKPIVKQLQQCVYSLDGQLARASAACSGVPRYILNLFDSDNLVCLEQVLVGPKENEITRSTEIISKIDVAGAVITCDALNTQTKFAAQIIESRADYCMAVKDNQKLTHEAIKDWFKSKSSAALEKEATTEDKAHGRLETRSIRVLPGSVLSLQKEILEKWPGLEDGCIVEITSKRTILKENKNSVETRYYITSLNFDKEYICERLMRIIRQHWRVENNLHWVLDVTYDQDRTQCKNADFLRGKALVNKVAFNWISTLQRNEEESTGKTASSHPVWMARMSNVDTALKLISGLYSSED